MVKSAWHDTTFTTGDRITFELEEYGAAKPSVVEWLVSDSYEEYNVSDNEAVTYIAQGHLRYLDNGDLINDYSDEYGIGLLIGGSENIFPKAIRLLDKGEVVIDRSALVPVNPEDLKLGDRIVVEDANGEYTLEFELTEENFDGYEDDEQIYGAITTITFPSGGGDDKLLGKYV